MVLKITFLIIHLFQYNYEDENITYDSDKDPEFIPAIISSSNFDEISSNTATLTVSILLSLFYYNDYNILLFILCLLFS